MTSISQPADAPQPAARRAYFPELDGVRAIAILMVMLFHLNTGDLHIPGPVILGQTGVDLFFVLSGFLITGILLKAPQRDWHEVRTFYIRRALRIFPLYYFALIVLWIGLMHDHVSWDVWAYVQNITTTFGGRVRGPWHFWSLAVEEQFYLVWPFLVMWLPRRWLGKVLAVMIASAVLCRVPLMHFGYGTFYFTLSRVDALGAGAVLALLQYRGQLARMRGMLTALLFVGLVLLAVQSRTTAQYWTQLTKFTVLAMIYASVVGLVLLRVAEPVNSLLRSAPLRFVGRISYGLYVFHPFVFRYSIPMTAGMPGPLRALISLAIAFACALLSWYGMERYLIGLKDRLAPERARFPAAAPAMTAL